jgi:hypothetical protein
MYNKSEYILHFVSLTICLKVNDLQSIKWEQNV